MPSISTNYAGLTQKQKNNIMIGFLSEHKAAVIEATNADTWSTYMTKAEKGILKPSEIDAILTEAGFTKVTSKSGKVLSRTKRVKYDVTNAYTKAKTKIGELGDSSLTPSKYGQGAVTKEVDIVTNLSKDAIQSDGSINLTKETFKPQYYYYKNGKLTPIKNGGITRAPTSPAIAIAGVLANIATVLEIGSAIDVIFNDGRFTDAFKSFCNELHPNFLDDYIMSPEEEQQHFENLNMFTLTGEELTDYESIGNKGVGLTGGLLCYIGEKLAAAIALFTAKNNMAGVQDYTTKNENEALTSNTTSLADWKITVNSNIKVFSYTVKNIVTNEIQQITYSTNISVNVSIIKAVYSNSTQFLIVLASTSPFTVKIIQKGSEIIETAEEIFSENENKKCYGIYKNIGYNDSYITKENLSTNVNKLNRDYNPTTFPNDIYGDVDVDVWGSTKNYLIWLTARQLLNKGNTHIITTDYISANTINKANIENNLLEIRDVPFYKKTYTQINFNINGKDSDIWTSGTPLKNWHTWVRISKNRVVSGHISYNIELFVAFELTSINDSLNRKITIGDGTNIYTFNSYDYVYYTTNEKYFVMFKYLKNGSVDVITSPSIPDFVEAKDYLDYSNPLDYLVENPATEKILGDFSNAGLFIRDKNNNLKTNTDLYIAYLILFGKSEKGSAISYRKNTPNFSDNIVNLDDMLSFLKVKFPDLWANRIEINTIQTDGSVSEEVAIPISIPKEGVGDEPITKENTQYEQEYEPTTEPEEKKADTGTITNIITKVEPEPEPKPDTGAGGVGVVKDPTITITEPDPEPPNTGEGTVPPLIIPIGTASALWSIYNPTLEQVKSLGGWLWSSNFADQILKVLADPMQAIISLHKVFGAPSISGTGEIKVGYLSSGISGVNIVNNQYTHIDCGSVNLYEYFGNVFDYPPYTDIQIYLPFIGIVPLRVEDVLRATITVTYDIDVLTGACLANIDVLRDNAGGVLYSYNGNCAVEYPLSSGSYLGVVSTLLGIAGGFVAGGAAGGVVGGALSVINSKGTDIKRSGNLSGNVGAMGIKKPYVIISRPITAMTENYQKYMGIPTNSYAKLSDCKGFVKCKEVFISGGSYAPGLTQNVTSEQANEIESLLKQGVIIN